MGVSESNRQNNIPYGRNSNFKINDKTRRYWSHTYTISTLESRVEEIRGELDGSSS